MMDLVERLEFYAKRGTETEENEWMAAVAEIKRLRAERDGADAAFELVQADIERLRAEVAELRAGRTPNMPTFVKRALAIAQVAEQHAAGWSLKGSYAQEIINEADELEGK